jgi:hypothetical protein
MISTAVPAQAGEELLKGLRFTDRYRPADNTSSKNDSVSERQTGFTISQMPVFVKSIRPRRTGLQRPKRKILFNLMTVSGRLGHHNRPLSNKGYTPAESYF